MGGAGSQLDVRGVCRNTSQARKVVITPKCAFLLEWQSLLLPEVLETKLQYHPISRFELCVSKEMKACGGVRLGRGGKCV